MISLVLLNFVEISHAGCPRERVEEIHIIFSIGRGENNKEGD